MALKEKIQEKIQEFDKELQELRNTEYDHMVQLKEESQKPNPDLGLMMKHMERSERMTALDAKLELLQWLMSEMSKDE